jgi:hypothetical protein
VDETKFESPVIFEGLAEHFASQAPSGFWLFVVVHLTSVVVLTEKILDSGENSEKKPAKKGKELRVLDPKSAQNLCM